MTAEQRAGSPGVPAEALVSVVIPCYRQAHFLPEAIESVLAQSHRDFEIIVIDDGSPDETEAVAKRYPHVRYVRQTNQGLAAARNAGVRASAGAFVVCLDADDRLMPEALAAGLHEFEAHPECAFVGGAQRMIGSRGELLPVTAPRTIVSPDHHYALVARNPFYCPAVVMFRRFVFDEVGGFDPALSPVADYDLYLRIARRFPLRIHDRVVADYRVHDAGMSRDDGMMLKFMSGVLRAHRRAVRANPEYVQACDAGIAACRAWYGKRLLAEINAHVKNGAWRRVLGRGLLALRYHPRGLIAMMVDRPSGGGDASQPPAPAVAAPAVPKTPEAPRQDTPRSSRQQTSASPRVSVVIPCYNQAHYLGEAIDSVRAQTFGPVEIIVVDDGSSDDVQSVTRRYEGVRYIRQENQGQGIARNNGLQHASGDYVIFLDSDDRLKPEAVALGVSCLEAHPECAFVSGRCVIFGPFGENPQTALGPADGRDHYLALLEDNYIWTPGSVVFRAAVVRDAGGFTATRGPEDYALYLRIARAHPVWCHNHVVTEYRHHDGNFSKQSARMLRGTVAVLRGERRWVRGNPRAQAARRRGLRAFQQVYGDPLVDEIRLQVREGEWRQALRGLVVLLRYYPRGFLMHVWKKASRVALGHAPEPRETIGT
jgi:glycosyltransferase involved in cell wall biosynthesis